MLLGRSQVWSSDAVLTVIERPACVCVCVAGISSGVYSSKKSADLRIFVGSVPTFLHDPAGSTELTALLKAVESEAARQRWLTPVLPQLQLNQSSCLLAGWSSVLEPDGVRSQRQMIRCDKYRASNVDL